MNILTISARATQVEPLSESLSGPQSEQVVTAARALYLSVVPSGGLTWDELTICQQADYVELILRARRATRRI